VQGSRWISGAIRGACGPRRLGALEAASERVRPERHGAPVTARLPRESVAAPAAVQGRRLYATVLLALVFMLAAADRNIMSILLVPIQKDIGASDTAMGVLTGAAFSLVYATAALPLARFADRGHRRNLVAAAVALWSLMTAACGVAVSYGMLLAARIGVALGEAAHSPAIISMVGDLYPRERRGLALAFVGIGTAVGVGAGAAAAGFVSDRYGWRAAFLIVGAPGLILAALLVLTLREPARGRFDAGADATDPGSALGGLRGLWTVPTVRRLTLAQIFMQMGIGGFNLWSPAFFMRVHKLSATQMGLGFGLAISVAAALSMAAGGVAGDRLSRRGEHARARYCAVSVLVGAPFALFTALAPSATLAFIGLFLTVLASAGATTAALALGIAVVPHDRRGLLAALMGFCVAVIGGGLGPVVMGAANDLLEPAFGLEAIRFSLLLTPALFVLAGVVFVAVGRTANEDAGLASRAPA
jgi:MFS family permease